MWNWVTESGGGRPIRDWGQSIDFTANVDYENGPFPLEDPPPPGGIVGDDDYQPNTSPITRFTGSLARAAVIMLVMTAAGDEALPVTPATSAAGQSHSTIITTVDRIRSAASFLDDEVLPFAANPAIVGDEPQWIATRQIIPWSSQSFSDDEIGSPLANFYLDSDEPWTAVRQAIPWQPRAFADDEFSASLANFALDHAEPWPDVRQVIPWRSVPFQDDEFSTSLTNFYLEDDAAPAMVCWPIRPSAQPFADDEILAIAVAAPAIEIDYWSPATVRYSWSAVSFWDDEALPVATVVVDEQGFQELRQSIPWTVRSFWADEEIAAIMATEGDEWIEQRQARTWISQSFSADEEIVQVLGIDDDPAWVAAPAWSWSYRQQFDATLDPASVDWFIPSSPVNFLDFGLPIVQAASLGLPIRTAEGLLLPIVQTRISWVYLSFGREFELPIEPDREF